MFCAEAPVTGRWAVGKHVEQPEAGRTHQLVQCAGCNNTLREENLAKHQRKRCPARPSAVERESTARKLAKRTESVQEAGPVLLRFLESQEGKPSKRQIEPLLARCLSCHCLIALEHAEQHCRLCTGEPGRHDLDMMSPRLAKIRRGGYGF